MNSPWRLLTRGRAPVVLALSVALPSGPLLAACTEGSARASVTPTAVAPEGSESPEGAGEQVAGPHRGCLTCHEGEHSLAREVRTADPGHLPLPDDATVATCLSCHSEMGVEVDLSPIPSHTFSGISVDQLGGTCFSCHDIDSRGSFQLLGREVATDDRGVPNLEELAPDGSIRPTR